MLLDDCDNKKIIVQNHFDLHIFSSIFRYTERIQKVAALYVSRFFFPPDRAMRHSSFGGNAHQDFVI